MKQSLNCASIIFPHFSKSIFQPIRATLFKFTAMFVSLHTARSKPVCNRNCEVWVFQSSANKDSSKHSGTRRCGSTAQILNIKTSSQDVGNYLPFDTTSSLKRLESPVITVFRQSWILHVEVDRLLLPTLYKEKVLEPTLKSSSENSLDWQWKLRNSVTAPNHKLLFLFNTVLVTLQGAYPLHAMYNAMNSG